MTVSTVSVGEMMWSTSRILKLINEHNGNNLVLKLLFLIKTAPLLKCAWPCSSFSLYRHWPGFSACSLKADDLRALSRETGIPVTLVKPFTFPRGSQSFPQTDKAKPGCHISPSCFCEVLTLHPSCNVAGVRHRFLLTCSSLLVFASYVNHQLMDVFSRSKFPLHT